MSYRKNKSSFGIYSLILGLFTLLSPSVTANEVQLDSDETSSNENNLAQVTSVSQFRDVSPTDWAFEALRNLVENYGCIEGYPDRTYRGNRPLSRYEFAAGMNACLAALERRLRDESTVVTPESQPNQSIGISTNEMFNRAFYDRTGRFYNITSFSGQANLIFGWRRLPNSFFDTMIAEDAELFGTIYQDEMNQQTAHTLIRTRDLPNPYDTSVSENPNYTRTTVPEPTREIRF